MKTGRNDSCPCGSGKKFKNCCGQIGLKATDRPSDAQPAGREPQSAQRAPQAAPQPDLSRLAADLRAGRYLEVERNARALVVRYPKSGLVWKFLGVSLGLQGKEALQAFETAAKLLPQDAEAQLNLANALRAAGRLEDAVACYRRVLALAPGLVDAHSNLGNALHALGQLDAALASYRKAFEIEPDGAEANSDLGTALLKLGMLQEAAVRFRRALEIKPNFALAHGNLGYALQNLGRLREAEASLRRAVELAPDFAAAHTNLGNALRDLGRFDDAVASHRRALQILPRFAEANVNLGNALRDLGQNDGALQCYRRALEIDPNLAVAHCNLGGALRELGRIGEAEASFRQALALKPDYAEAHSNLGVVLRTQNRLLEAEASCRTARDINASLPAAIVLMAELRADQGRFAEAEALFRQAIAIEPDSAEAWAGICGLRKMTPNDSAWLIEAQRIASRPLPKRQEIQLRYAIGKFFDDVGDYGEAFTNYRRANELTKQCNARYDRQQQANAVSLAIRRYDHRWLSKSRGDGFGEAQSAAATARRSVFIVGMPRSGTSLAEQILASHPQVYGAGELPFWNQASANYESAAFDREVGKDLAGPLGREYLRLQNELSSSALRVVDKMPSNFLHLGLIHAALPDACFIHMRRNPIDTCLSIYFQNFDAGHSYANDLEDLAHYFGEYSRLMRHWNSLLPEHAIMEVSYEGLVDDQAAWSRKMLEFIGLAWDERCLDFRRTERAVVTRSRWQVRQSINRGSVERWRRYEQFIGPLLRLQDNGT